MLEIVEDAAAEGGLLGGRYRLVRRIGEGGMGVVWEASEVGSDRFVAVKMLHAQRAEDPLAQERFLREARAVMDITHPNVVRVEAVLETDAGSPFLVMELLKGESLRALLSRRGALRTSEVARLVGPVIEAVAAAHERGIVHRDLKPENVFLTPSGDVKVLDFGIAKRFRHADDEVADSRSLTSTGAIVGTPHYMAPEQIFDDTIDERADVWALGVMLYECVAGVRPTEGAGFGQVLKRITTEPLVPLAEASPGVPRAFAALVDRMLARPRAERPTLAEVRAVLEVHRKLPEALTISERTPEIRPAAEESTDDGIARTTHGDLRVPAKRWPALVAVGAVAIVGVAAAIVVPKLRAKAPVVSPEDPLGGMTEAQVNEATALAMRAVQGLGERKGAACVADLDAHDRLERRAYYHSTNPSSPWVATRAYCLMLSGKCKEGRALAEAWGKVTGAATGTNANIGLDGTVAGYCEGNDMDPRDAMLVASRRLDDTAGGLRNATGAECIGWYESLKKLAPIVAPKGTDDAILTNAVMGVETRVATCLARAGECATARRIYLAESNAKRTSDVDENSFTAGAEAYLYGVFYPTPCRGK